MSLFLSFLQKSMSHVRLSLTLFSFDSFRLNVSLLACEKKNVYPKSVSRTSWMERIRKIMKEKLESWRWEGNHLVKWFLRLDIFFFLHRMTTQNICFLSFQYSVWNVLWIGWNVFLICFYLNVGILDRVSIWRVFHHFYIVRLEELAKELCSFSSKLKTLWSHNLSRTRTNLDM